MRITRLHLRNFRVYEDPLDLDVPAGLVGIYGPNGAGKSALLESVLWTLWGRARTSKDGVCTSGVNGECVTEVEFEHEGHLYVVRRSISGRSSTVKAEAHADGLQVSEGVADTGRYVQSVLGMDDGSFRSSVFAEQGQIASFSVHGPAERRRLVLGLLGVTPLDRARDQSRKDAREARERVDRLRHSLSDTGVLEAELATAESGAAKAAEQAAERSVDERRLEAEADGAGAEVERLTKLAAEHDMLCAEGRFKRDQGAEAGRRAESLRGDLDRMAESAGRLAELEPVVAGLAGAEEELRLAREVEEAAGALEGAPVPPEPVCPEPDALLEVEARAREAAESLAEVEGQLKEAGKLRAQASEALEGSSSLSPGGECPMCGQELGVAFEKVRRHRESELAEARERVEQLSERRVELTAERESAEAAQNEARRRSREVEAAWAAHEKAAAAHAAAEQRVAAARAAREARVAAGRAGLAAAALATEVEERRAAAEEASRLRGRLERRERTEEDLARETAAADKARAEVEALRERVRELGYNAEDLEAAERQRDESRSAHREAAARARQAEKAVAEARSSASALAGRLDEARRQRAELGELEVEVRHVSRTSELLSAFRDSVVATIGPRLSAQAAGLFGELTDHEYDRLEVNPETFEIRVLDQGTAYGMARFSGSETDLANLALRVAISEQVRFQSGGAVGLLVLDEVFGPLDDDRRERMLVALERLKARFRQVLVVTHSVEVKEQLPNAIEVVKLPGRRATARVL